MLFNLGLFHKREAKPAQWAVFDSAGKDEDELIDDLDALAGLEAIDPAGRARGCQELAAPRKSGSGGSGIVAPC